MSILFRHTDAASRKERADQAANARFRASFPQSTILTSGVKECTITVTGAADRRRTQCGGERKERDVHQSHRAYSRPKAAQVIGANLHDDHRADCGGTDVSAGVLDVSFRARKRPDVAMGADAWNSCQPCNDLRALKKSTIRLHLARQRHRRTRDRISANGLGPPASNHTCHSGSQPAYSASLLRTRSRTCRCSSCHRHTPTRL